MVARNAAATISAPSPNVEAAGECIFVTCTQIGAVADAVLSSLPI